MTPAITRMTMPRHGLAALAALAAACGGGSSAPPPPRPPIQMGGAIQGPPLDLTGAVSTLAGSTLGNAGMLVDANFDHPTGVVFDSTVTYAVLVADTLGHTIQAVTSDQVNGDRVDTIAGQPGVEGYADGPGGSARFSFPRGLALDGAGALYVSDFGTNLIRKIDLASGTVSTFAGTPGAAGLVDGGPGTGQLDQPAGLAFMGGVLYVADSGNNAIRTVSAAGVLGTLAGGLVPGSSDGTGSNAAFRSPLGIVAADPDLYVADTGNHALRQVQTNGAVSTVAGVAGSWGFTDGLSSGRLNAPIALAYDAATGQVYVADSGNHAIRSYDGPFNGLRTLAGDGLPGDVDRDGTTSLVARFRSPMGLFLSGGFLTVADTDNFTLRGVDTSTGKTTTVGGRPNSADGVGAQGRFYAPAQVTTDGTNLYLADEMNDTIRKVVIATGAVTTVAGSPFVSGSSDGTGTAATFLGPAGITTDGTSLFVADSANFTIRKVSLATGQVTTLAGVAGTSGRLDGPGATALFGTPSAITTDGASLFVADSGLCTIRKVVIATGVVSTLAGSPAHCGNTDGTGAAASFEDVYGITADGTTVFVTDRLQDTVRAVSIATGAVRTLAGSPRQRGHVDATGSAARFDQPMGVTTDGTSLFVVEASGRTVRKVDIATGAVTTLAGQPGVIGMADGAAATFRWPVGVTCTGSRLYVTDAGNATVRVIR